MTNKIYVIFFLFSFSLNAQTILEGNVVSIGSNEPLEYANVTLLSKNNGISTNKNGLFSFKIRKEDLTDSLQVSYIGYKTQKFQVVKFLSSTNKVIALEAEENILEEVTLELKKKKYTSIKTIGEKKQLFKFGSSVPFGYENAIFIINPENKKGKIKAVKIIFKGNKSEIYDVQKAFFQIKFYKKDSLKMLPSALLSLKKIIIKPENKSQVFKLDVEAFNIPLPKEGVFVSITPVNSNKKKPKTLMYVVAPVMKWTYADRALTYKSFRGKPWRLSKTKHKSKKPLSKTKESFANPMLSLNVKYIKD